MKRIIRSTSQNIASAIPITSVGGNSIGTNPQTIFWGDTSKLSASGNPSASLQRMLEQPPSVLARMFLLGSVIIFAIVLTWLWSWRIEQISHVQARFVQPQGFKISNPQTSSQSKLDTHQFAPTPEIDKLLEQMQTLSQTLVDLQVNAKVATTLLQTIPATAWEVFRGVNTPVLSESVLSHYYRGQEKKLVQMSQLPASAIHQLKTGDTVEISLESTNSTQLVTGKIIGTSYAIAADDFVVAIPSHPQNYQHQPSNSIKIAISKTSTTPARIIEKKRVIDIFWDNIHTPATIPIN